MIDIHAYMYNEHFFHYIVFISIYSVFSLIFIFIFVLYRDFPKMSGGDLWLYSYI